MTRENVKKNILIVEDDVGLAILMDNVISDMGFLTHIAGTGQEMLNFLEINVPSLILLDYSLPDTNALELIDKVRDAGLKMPPFIVATGRGDELTAVRMMKLGARDYLVKDIRLLDNLPISISRSIREVEIENDLTEAQSELLDSEEKFRTIMDILPVVVLLTDSSGNISYTSPASKKLYGYSEDELQGKDILDFVHINDKNSVVMSLANKSCAIGNISVAELRFKKKNGEYIWMEMISRKVDNNSSCFGDIVVLVDINKRKIAETQIRDNIKMLQENEKIIHNMAYFDSLTDLPNRFSLLEEWKKIRNNSNMENTAVIFLDIDNFKSINDTMGHPTGDNLLRIIGKRLRGSLYSDEFIARLSGDEYIFLLQYNEIGDVYDFISRIRAILSEPVCFGEAIIYVSGCFGISIYPEDAVNFDDLLRDADTAMYKAKKIGRDNFRFFNESMKNELIKKVEIEAQMKEALKRNEFFLAYQPLVDIRSGRIRGCEALLRWRNDRIGEITPTVFIPIAEETGEIIAIGKWVLETACRKSAEWREKYSVDIVMSVNISAIQLKDNSFISFVAKVLKENNLNPSHLELEITESVLIDSFDVTLEILNELKNLGVRISLDDFGTGYSSLNYLKILPIDTLKIDKSFIQNIAMENSVEKTIVGSLIALVNDLNLESVAEGIEKDDQLDYLRKCSCAYAQGFLIGHPLGEEEIIDMLIKQ